MSAYSLRDGDSGGVDDEGRAFTMVACDHCSWKGKHIPRDQDASEIDLIGFMGPDFEVDKEDAVQPTWMCQSCYEAYQAINPLATPVCIQFMP